MCQESNHNYALNDLKTKVVYLGSYTLMAVIYKNKQYDINMFRNINEANKQTRHMNIEKFNQKKW